MNYHNAVKRLLTAPHGSDPRSAERVSLLCRKLDLSLKGMTVVTVSGSSGKSACVTMLSHALVSRGYRVGAITTPFSHEMTECISTDNHPIAIDDLAVLLTRVYKAVNDLQLSFNELKGRALDDSESLTKDEKTLLAVSDQEGQLSPFADELLIAASLAYFANKHCQIVIIEIPTGSRAGAYRLPIPTAVNVITATHTAEDAARICRLLDKRARETVTALQEREVYSVISNACVKTNCRLTMPLRSAFYPADLAANRIRFFYKEIELSLNSGAYYQATNVLTVWETLEALRRQGLSADPAAADFQGAEGTVGIDLQFSFLSLHPTVITDFADTGDRIKAFAKSLSYHRSFLGEDITVLTCSDAHSTVSDAELSDILKQHSISAHRILRVDEKDLRKALKPFLKELSPKNTLLILGSRPFVYEATRAFRGMML